MPLWYEEEEQKHVAMAKRRQIDHEESRIDKTVNLKPPEIQGSWSRIEWSLHGFSSVSKYK